MKQQLRCPRLARAGGVDLTQDLPRVPVAGGGQRLGVFPGWRDTQTCRPSGWGSGTISWLRWYHHSSQCYWIESAKNACDVGGGAGRALWVLVWLKETQGLVGSGFGDGVVWGQPEPWRSNNMMQQRMRLQSLSFSALSSPEASPPGGRQSWLGG